MSDERHGRKSVDGLTERAPRRVLTLIGAIAVGIAVLGYNWHRTTELPWTAEFGDAFGWVNALFSGLGVAFVAYTLLLQHEDLRLAHREFDELLRMSKEQSADLVAAHRAAETRRFLDLIDRNELGAIDLTSLHLYPCGLGDEVRAAIKQPDSRDKTLTECLRFMDNHRASTRELRIFGGYVKDGHLDHDRCYVSDAYQRLVVATVVLGILAKHDRELIVRKYGTNAANAGLVLLSALTNKRDVPAAFTDGDFRTVHQILWDWIEGPSETPTDHRHGSDTAEAQ